MCERRSQVTESNFLRDIMHTVLCITVYTIYITQHCWTADVYWIIQDMCIVYYTIHYTQYNQGKHLDREEYKKWCVDILFVSVIYLTYVTTINN